ncbi:MAG: sigma-54-dependent Fis family transcriptional regulator [Lysobacteraceae bacterium]|nr:MAG: sigma-54-dependent Fis family transcriptional regulator [Xanthomonadaceae bacterium]
MPVLIVDDDENILIALKLLLKSEGIGCVACRSPKEALAAQRRENCELALVDLNYVGDTTSGAEGLELISALRKLDADLPIIAMTAWGTIGVAVEAMRRGASDFIEKPWDDNNRLITTLRTQMRLRSVQARVKILSAENALLREQNASGMLVCESQSMKQLLSMSRKVAASSMPVLITGENGTGKTMLANYIHRHSQRAEAPFISVDMGAIPETTFESEMYGHTRGAFTDAKQERMGRVEMADQGTLFMDEIANMPLSQQAKILRLVEDHKFEKLGSSQTRHIDVRFISATNNDLENLIVERGFRRDLLYRLNGVTLHIPALRERRADILPLADNALTRAKERYDSPVRGFTPAACAAMEHHAWPGNVRELQHAIERAVLLAQQELLDEHDLQLSSQQSEERDSEALHEMTLDEAEIRLIQHSLRQHHGNAQEAAKALGISRSALYRRLAKRAPG